MRNVKKAKLELETISRDLGLPIAVVVHAFMVSFGDSSKARRYLLDGTTATDAQSPWLPEEDAVLQGQNNPAELKQLINRRGKEACKARADFLKE